jgi:hypothetical protein
MKFLSIRELRSSTSHLKEMLSDNGKVVLTTEMADEMADVSAINVFGHLKNCRTDNKELLQPIHFVYDKPPRDIATN